ncbi:hypothetical protein Nmel_009967, partial [Mimus melanotis]
RARRGSPDGGGGPGRFLSPGSAAAKFVRDRSPRPCPPCGFPCRGLHPAVRDAPLEVFARSSRPFARVFLHVSSFSLVAVRYGFVRKRGAHSSAVFWHISELDKTI